jgi:hypothetical protein
MFQISGYIYIYTHTHTHTFFFFFQDIVTGHLNARIGELVGVAIPRQTHVRHPNSAVFPDWLRP